MILFRIILLGSLLLAFPVTGSADEIPADSADSTAMEAFPDSAGSPLIIGNNLPATYSEQPDDSAHYQKPTVALFKSMLVPGLGQIGNRRYIKAGLAIALESVFIGAIIHWSRKTSDAWDRFQLEPDSSIDQRASLYQTYLNYKDSRNYYSWLLGTTIFLSMFDAYVDAHLRKFPKFDSDDEGLSLDIGPTARVQYGLVLKYRF